MVIETCPIAPCPLSPTEALVDAIIPIGACIESPGKSYIYQIISAPIKRTYLDFKGLFEEPIHKDKVLDDVSDRTILSFLSQYLRGRHFILPSIGRMFWVFLGLLLLESGKIPHWFLNSTIPLSPFRLMPHLDESSPKHKGRTHYHTYKVNVFYKPLGATYWHKGNPTVITVRWNAVFIPLPTLDNV